MQEPKIISPDEKVDLQTSNPKTDTQSTETKPSQPENEQSPAQESTQKPTETFQEAQQTTASPTEETVQQAPEQPIPPSSQEANWSYSGAEQPAGQDMAETTGVPMQKIPAVSWNASEYVSHEKNIGWYAALFAATIVLVAVVFAITRDVLASVAIFVATGSMGVYAGRKPGTKSYTIDENGITIDGKMYSYAEVKSFSVVEEGALNSIWLKPIKRFSPMIVMYFSPTEEDNIVNVLSNFLPHEERQLDAVDRFSKRIRF